ncbi:unnamed protein product [Periconia digitata]|uniref:Uncharacterized protein n=1 Tax=Periconia digitata TaxID=1303443 RepID=A0A9W4UFT8_9PLEO|nr:unnamed protein product [Periconia digitata]
MDITFRGISTQLSYPRRHCIAFALALCPGKQPGHKANQLSGKLTITSTNEQNSNKYRLLASSKKSNGGQVIGSGQELHIYITSIQPFLRLYVIAIFFLLEQGDRVKMNTIFDICPQLHALILRLCLI